MINLTNLQQLNTYSENFGATDIERGLKRNSSTSIKQAQLIQLEKATL
ncbi:MAG: hypothetical protein CM15mV122_040 [uncultured marine virus]|nr:MAG: hypothetical protein CM15mV122_040 [uncultured marine virus]